MINEILKKIKKKNFTVGIIGLGYVGLPLFTRFAEVGLKVYGFDIDKEKIRKLKKGISYIKHVNFKFLKKTQIKGCKFESDYLLISQVDVIILCLPTPLKKNQTPELKYIKDTIYKIKKFMRAGQVLSLESTTYPGTTEEFIAPTIMKKFDLGKNYFLVYSPEREDPGRTWRIHQAVLLNWRKNL
jgi:UDP-N-acetyl-D-glucosamine dehydrogenase